MSEQQQKPSIAGKINVNRNGEINISGSVNSTVGGDVVGYDRINFTTSAVDAGKLQEAFDRLHKRVETFSLDEDDKAELRDTLKRMLEEVKKGEEARPEKVERWLKFVLGICPDIFSMTVSALLNPDVRIGTAVRQVVMTMRDVKP
jgi:hypothetical protein